MTNILKSLGKVILIDLIIVIIFSAILVSVMTISSQVNPEPPLDKTGMVYQPEGEGEYSCLKAAGLGIYRCQLPELILNTAWSILLVAFVGGFVLIDGAFAQFNYLLLVALTYFFLLRVYFQRVKKRQKS